MPTLKILCTAILICVGACRQPEEIRRGSCAAAAKSFKGGLGLVGATNSTFSDAAGQFLASQNPKYDLVEKDDSYRRLRDPFKNGLALTNETTIESTNFDFYVGNTPLCDKNATVSRK